MRIGIDIRYLSHNLVGGVHTYVKHFVPALLENANGHDVFLYADTKGNLELTQPTSSVNIRYLPWKNGLYSVYHDLYSLKKAMAADQIEVAHFPANYGFGPQNAKTVITLHDEINVMPWKKIIRGHPKNPRTLVMMTYLHFCTTAAIRRANLIVTDSTYSKNQISHYTDIQSDQIVVAYLSIDPTIRQITDTAYLAQIRQKYGLERPFVLADGLKNPAVLVAAWKKLPEILRNSFQIVFFSRRPDPLPIVNEAVEAGYAKLLIRPPREDLVALYSQAQIFVFPSWIEGFGLPILEAMTCGAPVIASNRGSIPEVAGDAALIIDAEDASGLAIYIERLLTSPEESSQWQQRGFARAKHFSWTRNARQILDCYKNLD
jgi:glycosyltransferase involved in cell wall biosynthesis